jgi:hypothetical protein
MLTHKVSTWDVLESHEIARGLAPDERIALLCEYIDLRDDLQGMSLADYIDVYFAGDAGGTAPEGDPDGAGDEGGEDAEGEPSADGDGGEGRPDSLVGRRVVYRTPGENALSDAAGVTFDSDATGEYGVPRDAGTVSFVDVDGKKWSDVIRTRVYPIDPANYRVIHVMKREAKEIELWLAGKPSTKQPEGDVLRNLTVEFADFPDRIVLAVVNGKRPFVDRFVQLPDGGFEDDQKPTTRLFGEHCFRVRGKDYVVNVVSP